jgi:hypothetical protein
VCPGEAGVVGVDQVSGHSVRGATQDLLALNIDWASVRAPACPCVMGNTLHDSF